MKLGWNSFSIFSEIFPTGLKWKFSASEFFVPINKSREKRERIGSPFSSIFFPTRYVTRRSFYSAFKVAQCRVITKLFTNCLRKRIRVKTRRIDAINVNAPLK